MAFSVLTSCIPSSTTATSIVARSNGTSLQSTHAPIRPRGVAARRHGYRAATCALCPLAGSKFWSQHRSAIDPLVTFAAGRTRKTTTTRADHHRRVVTRASNDYSSLYPSINQSQPPSPQEKKGDNGIGVFWLLVVNFALFALDKLAGMGWVQSLYLNGANPQWWQFVTCTFCHYNWAHLSQNAFFLYVFGKLVEEEEGAGGVWVYYLICGLGGALASYFLGGVRGYSLGASGAVFGLFVVSVLIRLQFNLRKLLESVILGQFVLQQVANEVKNQAVVSKAALGGLVAGGVQVSHVAHLGGAVMGALFVLLLSRLPEAPSK